MSSHREELENYERFRKALDALGSFTHVVEYPTTQQVTRASRRVQVALPQDVDMPTVDRILSRFGGRTESVETRDGRTSAWVFVSRRHSAWGKILQWVLVVAGLASFFAGIAVVLRAEREKHTGGKRPFY